MQYYVAFGFHGIATILLVFTLLAYAGARLVATGHREHFKRGSDVFAYYCSPVLGRFFDWFITFAIYMSFVVILAGAGAAMAQQFGLPAGAGVAITALLSCVTVIGGFGRMLKVLGNLGPVIIAMVFAVAVVGLARGAGNLAEADRAIASMQLLRAADFWWLSAVSYVGISMIWLTTFLTRLGAEAEDGRRVTRGIVLGTAVFFSGVLVMTLAMMGNISALQGLASADARACGTAASCGCNGVCHDRVARYLHRIRAAALDGDCPRCGRRDAAQPVCRAGGGARGGGYGHDAVV